MKYALISSDGYVVDIFESDPYIPFTPTENHIELTDDQALQIEQNERGSWIIDGEVYSNREYFDKQFYDQYPEQFKIGLRRRFANQRYVEETSGIEFNGYLVKTDRTTQSILGNARQIAEDDPSFSVDWKVNESTFVTLDSDDILALSDIMVAHVQSLFTKEKNLNALIDAAQTYQDIKNIKW